MDRTIKGLLFVFVLMLLVSPFSGYAIDRSEGDDDYKYVSGDYVYKQLRPKSTPLNERQRNAIGYYSNYGPYKSSKAFQIPAYHTPSSYYNLCMNSDWVVLASYTNPKPKWSTWGATGRTTGDPRCTDAEDRAKTNSCAGTIPLTLNSFSQLKGAGYWPTLETYIKKNNLVGRNVVMFCSALIEKDPVPPPKPPVDDVVIAPPPAPPKPKKHPSVPDQRCTVSKQYTAWRNATSAQSFSFREIYSYNIQIDPVQMKDYNVLTREQRQEWDRTHHSQTNPSTSPYVFKTEYGKLLDKYNSDGTLRRLKNSTYSQSKALYDSVRRSLEDAIRKDERMFANNEITLSLSEANQLGLSRGGAFTVSRNVKYATISVGLGEKQTRTVQNCTLQRQAATFNTAEYYTDKCDVIRGNVCTIYYNVRQWVNAGTEERQNTSKTNLTIVQDRNFRVHDSYQIINVICNTDALREILDNINGVVIEDRGHSLFARTPIVKNAKANFLNSRNMTLGLFYFGKCDSNILCTADPAQSLSASDGKNNEQDKNAFVDSEGESYYGAQSGGENTNFFQFFRDGQNNEVRNDVWHMKNLENRGIIMPQKAKSTDLLLWKDSTPDIKTGNFKLYINGKPEDFSSAND